jgi:hypothetical protein
MKYRVFAFRAVCAALLAFSGALMSGCSVAPNFPVVEDQLLPGVPVPVPLAGAPLVPGLSCNLPDQAELDQAVEDAIGAFLAGIFTITKAELLSVEVTANEDSAGDFSTITRFALTLQVLDAEGARQEEIPLGSVENPDGFGRRVLIPLDPPADLLDIVRSGADCGTLALVAEGQYPGQDLTFDVSVRVRIGAGFRR